MTMGFERSIKVQKESLIWIAGQTFMMGSDKHYPEEAPAHAVAVEGFWIDATPVTNRQFGSFVQATRHVTVAETAPRAEDYPGALKKMLRPGSMVFTSPKTVDGPDITQWWAFKFGADWRHPYGGRSDIRGKLDHPVVHVSYSDALAYAKWALKDLPTEAEWELAARGGLTDVEFAWGEELMPAGKIMANTWQGTFPTANTKSVGDDRTSPVGVYPSNGYGIHDMIGNVWEWTTDFWSNRHPERETKSCCAPKHSQVSAREKSFDPGQPTIKIARRVLKGGSHLCAPNYCRRYRPAARHAEPEDTSTSHVGFRCVRRP